MPSSTVASPPPSALPIATPTAPTSSISSPTSPPPKVSSSRTSARFAAPCMSSAAPPHPQPHPPLFYLVNWTAYTESCLSSTAPPHPPPSHPANRTAYMVPSTNPTAHPATCRSTRSTRRPTKWMRTPFPFPRFLHPLCST